MEKEEHVHLASCTEEMDMEEKKEYMMFITRDELASMRQKDDIKLEAGAKTIFDATSGAEDIFAIYYTNPDIRIIRAELITKENFAQYLKP